MNSSTISPVRLPFVFCLLLDFPEKNDTDCEVFPNGTLNEENCFKCDIPGTYLFDGESGPIACIIIWILVVILGVAGVIANYLIIAVVRKRSRRTSFDSLLCVLAVVDLSNSLVSIFFATGIISYLDNWNRGAVTLNLYYFSILLITLGKSVSAYMTVFITVERYHVIANPVSSRRWFNSGRTTPMVTLIILLAMTCNILPFSSIRIGYNDATGRKVPILADKEYVIFASALEHFWYLHLKPVHYLDSLGPFVLLIIYNTLLFAKISKFARMRERLTISQKTEIHAARMFVPVVVVLFLCNVVPISFYILLQFYQTTYRELWFGLMISVTVNSAANLPIYYARGSSFREEVHGILPECLRGWLAKMDNQNTSRTVEMSAKRTKC